MKHLELCDEYAIITYIYSL